MNRLPLRFTTPSVTPSCSTRHVPRPGWRRQVVGRPDDLAALLQVGPDLAVAVGVVAERDGVDAGGEEGVRLLRRDADAAGRVLAVDHDEGRVDAPREAPGAASRACAARRARRRRRRTGSRCSAAMAAGRYRPRGAYLMAMPTLPDPTEPPPAPRRARPAAALGAARAAAAGDARRSWRSCAPPGPVLLLFIVAGLIALLLNPFVTLLRRAALPARAGGAVGDAVRRPARRRDRRPAGEPGGRPGVGVPAQRAGDRRRRERVAGRLPGVDGPQRDRPAGQGRGLDGAADARAATSPRAPASSCRSRATRCRSSSRRRSR